jgi:hypothetical protein
MGKQRRVYLSSGSRGMDDGVPRTLLSWRILMLAYQYLFYRLYRWSSIWKKDIAPPEINAFLLTVALMWVNALLMVGVVDICLGNSHSSLPRLSNLAIVALATLTMIPQYFLLLWRGKYKQIVCRFSSESLRQSIIRGIIVAIYIFLSFGLTIGIAIFRSGSVGR